MRNGVLTHSISHNYLSKEIKMKDNWHKRVYRRRIPNFISKDDWHKLRMSCLVRDNFTCQRCEKTSRQGMQAHHIIPRDQDGPDILENLITLCNGCHDIVEIAGFKTKLEIMASFEEGIIEQPKSKPLLSEEGYSFKRPDWHKYVYGGARRGD